MIVAVYNSELYIEKCVDSMLELKDINLEIVLVNDGSKDNVLEILKKYRDNPKVLIYTQENKGVGSTRNKGVELSSGKYIYFADGDDYINPENFSKVFKIMKEFDLDFIMADALEVDELGKVIKKRKKHSDILNLGITSGKNMFRKLIEKKSIAVEVWSNIYKREFLEKNNLVFKKYFYDDHFFTQQIYYYAKKVMYSNESFYNYVRRDNSITTSLNLDMNRRRIDSVKNLIKDLIEFNKEYKLVSKEWNFLPISNYYNYIFFLKQNRDQSTEKNIDFKNLMFKDKLKYMRIIIWR